MKKFTTIFLLLAMCSCAHQIPIKRSEECSLDSKKLIEGQCAAHVNLVEKCEIENESNIARVKMGWNNEVPGKNALIGIGYVLYVIPGVALYYKFASDRERMLEKISAIHSSCN